MADNTVMTLEDVFVTLGKTEILRGVSLTIPAGAITAVIGPSGAGKTTLLRVLNGLVTPDGGVVTAPDAGPLRHPVALRRHRQRTATVFQDHALIGRLSALDNVLLGLADQRHPLSLLPWSRTLRRRAAEALEDVGLLHCAHQPVFRLSGGERQRVGVARALARRPRLLLADEPFSAVDPVWAGRLGQNLRKAVDGAGLTLVVVLHQIETVRALADHVIGIVDGRVGFSGSSWDFDAAAERRLFRQKSMNEVIHAEPFA